MADTGAADAATAWRVATFNVRHCTTAGRLPQPVDVAATAEAIRSLGADVVALQELDAGLVRSGRTRQPEELARRLGMCFVFAPALRGLDGAPCVADDDNGDDNGDDTGEGDGAGGYGVALLSRRPVTDVTVRRLPGAPGLEPRVALCARTGGLSVVVTHLSTRRTTAEMQFAAVARHAMRMPSPRVVCGDMNFDVHGSGLLAASGLRSAARRRTWPRTRPLRQIDFVLHDGSLQAGAYAAPRLAVSDHRALVVGITTATAAAERAAPAV